MAFRASKEPTVEPARPMPNKPDYAGAVAGIINQTAGHSGGPQPAAPVSEDNRLIVGRNIQLKGEIGACDTLVVEGRVEASMKSRSIQIAESGVFIGEADVETAEIRGLFEGKLTAHKKLVVRAQGRVKGVVRYGSIVIEEGGRVSGDVKDIESGETKTQPIDEIARASENSQGTNGSGVNSQGGLGLSGPSRLAALP